MKTPVEPNDVLIDLLMEEAKLTQYTFGIPGVNGKDNGQEVPEFLFKSAKWPMVKIAKRHHRVELEDVVRHLIENGKLKFDDAYGYFYKESNPTLNGLRVFLSDKFRAPHGAPLTPGDSGRSAPKPGTPETTGTREAARLGGGDGKRGIRQKHNLVTMEPATKKVQ